MGQLVMTVVGGFVGGLIGGPLGASIGMTLGGMLGATLFGPTIEGPRLQDLKVSASTYGNAIPECWGTVRVGTNMIWSSGIKEEKHSSSGKGGQKSNTYTYKETMAVALCKGPIDGILRIWADSKLIYDAGNNSTRDQFQTGDLFQTIVIAMVNDKKKTKKYKVRIYKGTTTQKPDSLIEADKGVGNVSAHRGLAYLVFEDFQLEDFGNHTPSFAVELTKNMAANFPSLIAYDPDGTTQTSEPFWFPEWNSGRIFSGAAGYWGDGLGGHTKQGSLDTMRAAYSGGMGMNLYFIPERNLAVGEIGGSNSRVNQIWDMTTQNVIATFGHDSNSLGGVLYYGDYIQKAYGAGGTYGYGIIEAEQHSVTYLAKINWLRDTYVFKLGEEDPLPVTVFKAPFVPSATIPGRMEADLCDIVGWRENGVGLDMWVLTLSAGMEGQVVGVSPSMRYIPDINYTLGEFVLQPFGLGNTFAPFVVLCDRMDGTLFCMGKIYATNTYCAFKYSLLHNQYLWSNTYPGIMGPQPSNRYGRLNGGTFGWIAQSYMAGSAIGYEINLSNGELSRATQIGSNIGPLYLLNQGSEHWDDASSSVVMQTGAGYRRIFFRDGAGKVSLRGLVSELCDKTQVLLPTDYDVTGLTDDKVIGYTIDKQCTSRDALKQLASGYFFDGYESDYKLKFKSRGGSVIANIPENDLGRASDGFTVKETMQSEFDLPLSVSVNYYDVALDHQQGSQTRRRNSSPVPVMMAPSATVIELPIDWTATDAMQCADKTLKMAWSNRWSYKADLPWKYLKYDPTDVVTITLNNGTVFTTRITELNLGADFSMELTGVSEKSAAYTSTMTGNAGVGTPAQVIPNTYPIAPVILNTPLLRDLDYDANKNATTYVAAYSPSLKVSGASIYVGSGLEGYTLVSNIAADEIGGVTMNALPATRSYESTDETTVLRVRLQDDSTLSSVTQDAMVSTFANAALVGDEVIQFRDAVKQSNGEWWLSGLLRARRGTNYAVNTHKVGDLFILLTTATVGKFIRPPEQYTSRKSFKAISSGDTLAEAKTTTADLIPRDLQPFTPENLKISDDGTTVTVTMARRCRVTSPLTDGTEFIEYREGDKVSAVIKWAVWPTKTVADIATTVAATTTGSFNLFNPTTGADVPVSITFPLADLGGSPLFLMKAYEVGVVDGIPKWVAFERLGLNRWNQVEAY